MTGVQTCALPISFFLEFKQGLIEQYPIAFGGESSEGDTDFTLLYIEKVVAHLGLEGNEGLEKLLDELQVEVRAMGKDIEEVTVDLSA